MHRLIGERIRSIAEAMTFADHSVVELERLQAERARRARRAAFRPDDEDAPMGKLILRVFVLVVGLGAHLTPVLIQQQYLARWTRLAIRVRRQRRAVRPDPRRERRQRPPLGCGSPPG